MTEKRELLLIVLRLSVETTEQYLLFHLDY